MTFTSFCKVALVFICSTVIDAAHAQTNHIYQVPDTLPEQQLLEWKKTLPHDGWFILHFKNDGDRLFNYSNKDYEMNMWLHCNGSEKPGYLIEYSKNYGDGDFEGIDFIGSRNDNGNKIQFALDGKSFGNPFKEDDAKLKAFIAAMKKAQQLTISVYNKELNPETGKDEEKLNRSIDFKLAYSELLDKPVSCGN